MATFEHGWWVQNVLPVVFDNSLSYYEVLAKITWYLNGLSDDVSNVIKTLGSIEGIQDVEAYTQFLESIQKSIGSLHSLDTDEKDDIVSAINEVLGVAKKAYVKPKNGIPESDLDSALKIKINNKSVSSYNELTDKPSINGVTLVGNSTGKKLGLGTYSKPSTGIPESDLSTEVQEKLNTHGEGGSGTTNYNNLSNKPSINGVTLKGNNTADSLGLGTYSKPNSGIPMSDLSTEVQEAIAAGGGSGGTSNYNALINKPSINGHTLIGNLTLEDLGANYYVKPTYGIPESDLTDAVKEKLNAVNGIAESIDSFVADKYYSEGDLIYINGVLYKVTENVLPGTQLTEGDNIEKTDINTELEDINNKVDQINYDISGLTPFDSFRIAKEVTYYAGGWTRVFTDVSMIGTNDPEYAGNYLFTVKNKFGTPDWVEYMRLRILKHDGTLVTTINVPDGTTGEYRFTFNPPETGLYIVDIQSKVGYTGTDPIADVTLEYTTSQGITAIMTKLNAVEGVPERMTAVENLVEQQEDRIEALEGSVEDIPPKLDTVESKIDSLEENVDVINDALFEVSDNILIVNDLQSYQTNGITINKISDNSFSVYGTATAGRYLRLFNGTTGAYTSSQSYAKYIPAGRYKIRTEYNNDLVKLRYTYGTFGESLVLKDGITNFENAASVTFLINNHYDYGTEQEPTIITIDLEPVESEIEKLATVYPDPNGASMNSAIMACLNKYGICNLVKGTYNLGNILYPPANSTIRGVGNESIVKVDATAGFWIQANGITIQDLQIIGDPETIGEDGDVVIPTEEGNKTGIIISGTDVRRNRIINCFVHGFSNACIVCRDTGTGIRTDISIEGCTLWYSYYGLFIRRNSEFIMVNNCSICCNNYGVLSRGGNNKLCNCDIDSNIINVRIDQDEGSNGGHGSIVGCSMNHSNNRGNDGYSLIINRTGRMTIAGCQIHYGTILLEGTNGNVFSGCEFGSDSGIEIVNSGCNIFAGCMFRTTNDNPLTGNEDGDAKFIGCFLRNGDVYPPAT